jgi:hypothetical protein
MYGIGLISRMKPTGTATLWRRWRVCEQPTQQPCPILENMCIKPAIHYIISPRIARNHRVFRAISWDVSINK